MRVGEAVGKGIGLAVGFIASCGLSQLYGLIKGSVQLIKTAHCSYQIKKIDKQMEKIRALPPEKQEQLEFTQELRDRIVHKKEHEKDELKHAGLALIPGVGAILAVKYKNYSVGPLAPGVSVLEDIVEAAKPEGIPQVLFPGAKAANRAAWNCERWHSALHAEFLKMPVKMEGGKTRSIDALWVPGKDCSPSDRTVILYHGNAMNMWGMYDRALPYIEAGFNVLVTTIGGKQYEQVDPSDPMNAGFATNELSMYADVDAEFAFLESKGVKEVGVHGLSIGGTKAFQAAAKYQDKVKFVVAEQTLTSAGDVAANIANNVAYAGNLGRAIGNQAAPLGGYDAANKNRTDGLNNKAKAKMIQAEVIAIAAKEDLLMGKDKHQRLYKKNFAEELMQARYKEEAREPLWIEGGHSASIDPATYDKIIAFANTTCPKKPSEKAPEKEPL